MPFDQIEPTMEVEDDTFETGAVSVLGTTAGSS